MADSRPLPGPCTRTCTRLTPRPSASRAHCSAATVAANGVLFFEPLNPALPDEPHATALPCMSVIVTVVLLKVAAMCAIPSASMTRFDFLPVAITLLGYLLLAGNRPAWTLLRTRVRVGALAAHGQSATMTDATIRADVHQSLDVHRHFGAQRAFDLVIALDHLTQAVHVGVGEIANAKRRIDACLLDDVACVATTNTVDVRQADLDLLLAGEIDARNTSHDYSALTLLVLG